MSSRATVAKTNRRTSVSDIEPHGRRVLPQEALPLDRLERVPAWGEASYAMGYVYRPGTVDEIRDVLEIARRGHHSVGLRGAGNSYGDATLNESNITLDLGRLSRVLAWNPASGVIRVEPGVTIAQLWQYVIEDGWWPPVVPGTGKPTIGGCAGMNIHGKNAWEEGTFGNHIVEFDLLLPSGKEITCSRDRNERLFYAAIGGFGMLGIFVSLTLQLKRIYSGLIEVHALASRNLTEMMEQCDEHLSTSDYLVGWIDAFARGSALGRGQIHKATYLPEGADPNPRQSLQLEYQHLPEKFFLLLPRSMMWRLMRPFMNNLGARLVNFGKYWSSRWSHGSTFRQPHVAFHFLLDYLPDWKRSYGPDGLIQYQCFVPKDEALASLSNILRKCQERRLVNYLTVLKRHRSDEFLISHGVDGYSMAMDFRVTPLRRSKLISLAEELDEIVLSSGGRFYLAKDSTLRPEVVSSYLGENAVVEFRSLKSEFDPGGMLQTNLWRRLFDD